MREDPSGGEYTFTFDGEYDCPVCEERLETPDDVYEHVRLHDLDVDAFGAAGDERDGAE